MALYSIGNYISDMLDYLPILILPVLITNLINPEATAYYYMAYMVANLLFVIPESIGHSLFAEGSNDPNNLSDQTNKARLYIAGLLMPSVVLTILFGSQILTAFGKNYSAEGFRLLQLLAFSGLLYAVNVVFSTRFKVMHQVKKSLLSSFIGCIGYFSFIALFLKFGIMGVGLARIGAQSILLVCNYVLVKTEKS
jgi:O-antigen/teichoic acid export membrane protein